MFSKGSTQTTNKPRKPAAPPSIVSADLVVTGDILSEGEVQVEGTVNGDVKCVRLTIGPTGTVNGSIVAEDTLVRGSVNGQIRSGAVTLTKTAQVVGDVLHETLAIEAGARLEGHCRRIETLQAAGEARINLVVSDGPKA